MSPHLERSCRILLVEDNPADANLIRELLSGQSYVLSSTDCLKDGVDIVEAHGVDIVLLDLHLPDASGVECVSAVRAVDPALPIVVLTGYDDERLALACLAKGAQDYLQKAELRQAELQRAIAYAFARAEAAAERGRANALQRQLAAIVESSSDAIVSTDLEGSITSWNSGAEKVFGFKASEVLARSVNEVISAPAGAPQSEREASIFGPDSDSGAPRALEIVRARKDGEALTLSVVSWALRDEAGSLMALAAICRDVSETKRQDEELKRRHTELLARDKQMRALTVRLNAIREEERTRISREVHDELGQLLTGLKMDVRWCRKRIATPEPPYPEISRKLEEAEKLVDITLASVQRLAIELRPTALDALGLPSAIRDELRRFSERTGVATETRFAEGSPRTGEVATALFRVFQELLTNVARHAHASLVVIELQRADGGWFLRMEDDGIGIQEPAANGLSLGLLGMRERMEALGGSFTLEARSGKGTVAIARVPE